MTKKTDIIIIGSGMAGLSAAALLGQQGFNVTVVDRETPEILMSEEFDSRTVALSDGSRAILEPLNIWNEMLPYGTAIETIDVQEGQRPFILNFEAREVDASAFGWIFPNTVVRSTLYQAALRHGVRFIAPDALQDIDVRSDYVTATLKSGQSVQAQLLIGADGRFSRVRDLMGFDGVSLDYKQTALVGLITHEKPHHGLALERFYPTGPFAALPFTTEKGVHRSAIVWTQDTKRGKRLLVPDLHTLTQQLEPLLDERYGRIGAIGKWAAYPLGLYHAKNCVNKRIVLISDAAHAIHPIAGQGLNLGMRDVEELVQTLADARAMQYDIGDMDVLEPYQQSRRVDVLAMVAATDTLNRLFGMKTPGMGWVRNAGLGVVNRLPPLKKFFMKTAMGK